MKLKVFTKNLIIDISAVIVLCCSVWCAFAVDDITDNNPDIVTEAPTAVVYTDPPTQAPVIYTDPPTQAPVYTDPVYTPTQAPYVEEKTTPQSNEYAQVQETTAKKTLPTVATTQAPTTNDVDKNLTYGYVSWIALIVGIIMLFVILVSTKHQKPKKRRR